MRGKTRGFLCGLLIFLSGVLTYQVQGILLLPERHFIAVGEPLKLNFPAPFEKTLKAKILGNEDLLQFKESDGTRDFTPGSGPVASEPGQIQVRLSLFGVIPVRDMLVSVVPQVKVVPGGQSIGVMLHAQGVIVVGLSALLDEAGNKVNPAADAGIKEGDVILKIDGEAVRSDSQVKDMVAQAGTAGQPLTMEVKREEDTFTAKLSPVFCKETLRYRVGLMIRDSAAGVGTLTFYEPDSMIYGALGHVITDIGTSRPVELSDGKIVGASVQGIHKGKRGQPGEKIGMFQGDTRVNGTINRNTKLGIFGSLKRPLENPAIGEPIAVAMADQIHEGQAEILTVLKGEQVERFSIEIIKVNPLARQDGKGLVIKITDQRLLEQTGGIIQGMSGSPIIQDDKLVGAVTHVFVNDPTKGFGVPAEWMLWEAEILPKEDKVEKDQKMVS